MTRIKSSWLSPRRIDENSTNAHIKETDNITIDFQPRVPNLRIDSWSTYIGDDGESPRKTSPVIPAVLKQEGYKNDPESGSDLGIESDGSKS